MNPDSPGPAEDVIEYSDFSSDIDVNAVKGRPARWIKVLTAGAGTKLLNIQTAGSGANVRSLTTVDNWELTVQITKIKSTTTVTRVQVGF